MMIQFQCMCADCFFTDYMPRKFSLNRLRRAFSSWQTELDGRGWNALYLENRDHPRVIVLNVWRSFVEPMIKGGARIDEFVEFK